MLKIHGSAGLRKLVKQQLGTSGWHMITQGQIDAFAKVVDDHHWSHVDRERATKSVFGGTIAHGALTLSLEQKFSKEIYDIVEIDYDLDYGYRKVRFPAPVPAGSRVRMSAWLDEVVDVPNGVRCVVINTFELEGSSKPPCIAELILHIACKE